MDMRELVLVSLELGERSNPPGPGHIELPAQFEKPAMTGRS
jgi:hypothetical protein